MDNWQTGWSERSQTLNDSIYVMLQNKKSTSMVLEVWAVCPWWGIGWEGALGVLLMLFLDLGAGYTGGFCENSLNSTLMCILTYVYYTLRKSLKKAKECPIFLCLCPVEAVQAGSQLEGGGEIGFQAEGQREGANTYSVHQSNFLPCLVTNIVSLLLNDIFFFLFIFGYPLNIVNFATEGASLQWLLLTVSFWGPPLANAGIVFQCHPECFLLFLILIFPLSQFTHLFKKKL